MEEEDYGHEGGKNHKYYQFLIGSEMDGAGGMVYQDEDGNLIMYNHDEMGDEEDDGMGGGSGDDYGMEGTGSPGVRLYLHNCCRMSMR